MPTGRTALDPNQLYRLVNDLRSLIGEYFGYANTGTANVASDLSTFRGAAATAHAGGMDNHTAAVSQLRAGMDRFADSLHRGTTHLANTDAQNHSSLAAQGNGFAGYTTKV